MRELEPDIILDVTTGETLVEPLESELHAELIGSHSQAFHRDLFWTLSGAFRQANPHTEYLQKVLEAASNKPVTRPKRGKPGTLLAKKTTSASSEESKN